LELTNLKWISSAFADGGSAPVARRLLRDHQPDRYRRAAHAQVIFLDKMLSRV
jgi:hypothetical protein